MSCLERDGFFEGKLTEGEIERILRTPEYYVRFHKTKTRRLIDILALRDDIEVNLKQGLEPHKERDYLVSTVTGFGLKEASHALRNVGRKGLVILDRHILQCLLDVGVLKSVPQSLSEKTYLDIEAKMVEYSHSMGVSVDVLDLLFWSSRAGFIFK